MPKTTVDIPLAEELSNENLESIEALAADLRTAGIKVSLKRNPSRNRLLFCYDSRANKRNAGRKEKPIPPGSILNEMNRDEMDIWLLENSIETIEKELGVGRATAFRRRADARERLEYAMVSFNHGKDENNNGSN